MTRNVDGAAPAEELSGRIDERVHHEPDVADAARGFVRRMQSGELGVLPVIVGLVMIAAVFQSLNSVFLSSNNLVNLLFDSCSVGVISLGIVCVLMVGEIDLSVGSVSGFSSALLGVLWVNHGWPVLFAVLAAAASGAVIGGLYAVLRIRFGMPSFVATLAGLLAVLGLQLSLLGQNGSINLPYSSAMVNFGQLYFMPPALAYAVAAIAGFAVFGTSYRTATRRRAVGLSARSLVTCLTWALVTVVGLELIVWYLYRDRGVPWMFGLFVALVVAMNYALTRTGWGRSMTAVGGNREAARRAGIKVSRIYASAFVLCSVLAAVGGVLAAARLASASLQAGTGDVNLDAIAAAVIGGTSLFGGRGSAHSALLGIVVIQSIASGLTMLDVSSALRYIITGGVLAIAVIVDSLARKSRATHGRA